MSRDYYLGVDIGGTKTYVMVVGPDFAEVGAAIHPTINTADCGIVENTIGVIEDALNNAGVSLSQVRGVGIGVPGLVERDTGIVQMAVNLNLEHYQLGAELEGILGAPCYLENDVRLAALGAYYFGSCSASTLAFFNVGTGISSGLVIDGQLYRGVNGMAGEIGHVIVMPDGPKCKCGLSGCLETLVAGPSIARLAREAIASGAHTSLIGCQNITSREVYEMAGQGDEVAMRITKEVGNHLARALHMLVMAYDVTCVVLGGGVTKAGDLFLEPIKNAWLELHQQSAIARRLLRPEILQLAPPDKNLVALGGVGLALQGMKTIKR